MPLRPEDCYSRPKYTSATFFAVAKLRLAASQKFSISDGLHKSFALVNAKNRSVLGRLLGNGFAEAKVQIPLTITVLQC